VTALVFLMLLTVMGSIATRLATMDLRMADHSRTGLQASCAAESGIAETRERLRGPLDRDRYVGDPDTSIDPFWSAYILTSTRYRVGVIGVG
jgi:hypothetical protein